MTKGLFDCTGKVSMITGGNGGIGLGFAMGVARMGGHIAIWARNAEKNAAARAQLEAAGAGRVMTYQGDVSSEEQILAGYDQLMEDFGRVDGLADPVAVCTDEDARLVFVWEAGASRLSALLTPFCTWATA